MADTRTNAERAERRQMYLDRELARARAEAATRERSLKCSGGYPHNWPIRHTGEPGGCQDDGTRCLCACHLKTGGCTGLQAGGESGLLRGAGVPDVACSISQRIWP